MSISINRKAYDWGDISINIPGLQVQAQEISYNDELEKEAVYGRGSRPRGYGTGNYKSDGKMTMLLDDYESLLQYCRDSGVALYALVIPKIVVNYANDGGRIHTDVLETVTITKTSQKGAQGDKKLTVDVDLLIVDGITRDGVKAV